jgi:hypothetical protein
VRPANDGFRFLLELAVLVSLGYWGYRLTASPARWVLMLAAPIVGATIWATWVAAKSSSALHDPWRFLLEIAIFGAGAAALAWSNRATLAIVLAALAAVHLALTFVLDQRQTAASGAAEPALVAPPTQSGVS